MSTPERKGRPSRRARVARAGALLAAAVPWGGCEVFSIDEPPDRKATEPGFTTCSRTKAIIVDAGAQPNDAHLECTARACDLSSAGAALDYCCDGSSFAQCGIHVAPADATPDDAASATFDLNRFDADNGGSGYLEVTFCLSKPYAGAQLNLWYGDYPRRKKLRLLEAREVQDGVGPGCFIRYFAPEDAECPTYPAEVLTEDPAFQGDDPFPVDCLGAPEQPCRGRWAEGHDACKFDYSSGQIYLTVEICGPRIEGVARLVSLQHIQGCTCRNTLECTDPGARCNTAGVSAAFCPLSETRCAGLCTDTELPCDGAGEPCTVLTEGGTCDSRLVCRDGKAVCPAEACVAEKG